jgi:hypothetical protein
MRATKEADLAERASVKSVRRCAKQLSAIRRRTSRIALDTPQRVVGWSTKQKQLYTAPTLWSRNDIRSLPPRR